MCPFSKLKVLLQADAAFRAMDMVLSFFSVVTLPQKVDTKVRPQIFGNQIQIKDLILVPCPGLDGFRCPNLD
ncbi:unnamed protein product [Urochloa humidicola]